MLFYQNLDKIIYERHKLFKCDELVIVSGYVGPDPVKRINEIPVKTTIVYGMYGCDGIRQALHKNLVQADKTLNNVTIYYSSMPVHSKLYMWRYNNEVIHALIGSANFSTNGLTTPYKETLAETTVDTFGALDQYYDIVKNGWLHCSDGIVTCSNNSGTERIHVSPYGDSFDENICSLPLYTFDNGTAIVAAKSGLNWGMASLTGSHVNINDAYIPIPSVMVEHYPDLFPIKQRSPQRLENVLRIDHRDNDTIDIIWDDGVTMTGLLEGTRAVNVNGVKCEYPKQIATSPRKSELGVYLRNRLGVPTSRPITMNDLDRYGRRTVDISLQGEGIYYFDFSVKEHQLRLF